MNKTQMFVALCAAVLAQMAWAVTFSDGATVNVSLTDAQKAAYAERKLVTVLSSSNGISGAPSLLVNGQKDGNWTLVNTGTALKFGPRRGMMVIFK